MAYANAHKIVKALLVSREQNQKWLANRTGYRDASISTWLTKGFKTDEPVTKCLRALEADADFYRRCDVSQ